MGGSPMGTQAVQPETGFALSRRFRTYYPFQTPNLAKLFIFGQRELDWTVHLTKGGSYG